jgi:hypothetical protein
MENKLGELIAFPVDSDEEITMPGLIRHLGQIPNVDRQESGIIFPEGFRICLYPPSPRTLASRANRHRKSAL